MYGEVYSENAMLGDFGSQFSAMGFDDCTTDDESQAHASGLR
jgi:hypothetical protein